MMQTEQARRQAFVEQVRRVLGQRLETLSQRQEDLLNLSLDQLFAENRPVTDEELEGQLEVAQLVAPVELEAAAKVFLQGSQRAN